MRESEKSLTKEPSFSSIQDLYLYISHKGRNQCLNCEYKKWSRLLLFVYKCYLKTLMKTVCKKGPILDYTGNSLRQSWIIGSKQRTMALRRQVALNSFQWHASWREFESSWDFQMVSRTKTLMLCPGWSSHTTDLVFKSTTILLPLIWSPLLSMITTNLSSKDLTQQKGLGLDDALNLSPHATD